MKYQNLIIALLIAASGMSAFSADAQKLRKRPLQYVPADSVFVLPKGDRNIIMDVMAVAPFIGPQRITVGKEERKAAKRELTLKPGDERPQDALSVFDRTAHNAQMLLLTGHSSYANIMEHAYFYGLPAALDDNGILPTSEREAAAQQLLNLTGAIFATDNNRSIYINYFENCVARIHTSKFRLLLDMVSDYPDKPMVKIRINGLDTPNAQFALHIRVPEVGAPKAYFINGHEVLAPVYSDGYFVLDRKWRNGEEVYFILTEI